MNVGLCSSRAPASPRSLRGTLPMLPIVILAVIAVMLASMPPSLSRNQPVGTLKDASGHSIALAPPARRIVMFPPVLWDYLGLGADAKRLAAVSKLVRDSVTDSILHATYPAIAAVSTVVTRGAGTALPADAEDVMRHDPDAVLSWDALSDNLTNLDLPVVKLLLNAKTRGNEPHTADIANLRVMANLTGEQRTAEEMVGTYLAAVKRVSRRADEARAAAGRPSRAMFLSVRGGGQLYLEAPPFLQGRALQMAGADTKDFLPAGNFSAEQLLIWDPDVIFLDCCYGNHTPPAFFYDDPRFAGMSAVHNRRIYVAPAGVARMENMLEWPLLVSWLAEVLYPGHMAHTVRSDLARLYQEHYGFRPTPLELDTMLAIAENAASRDYALVGGAGH